MGSQIRELLKLAVPLALVQLGYHLLGFVDTALAGRLDEVSLAATGIGSSAFFVVAGMGLGICMGLDPLVSQAFGAGDEARAYRSTWHGLYVATLVALPLSLAMLVLVYSLEFFGISEELASTTRIYVFARLPSLWPMLLSVTLRSYLQAAHHTRAVVVAMIVTNIFNFLADWVLAFGDEGLERVGLPRVGLPALGVRGIAWASLVAVLGQCLVLMLATRLSSRSLREPGFPRPDVRTMRSILSVGMPIGLHLLVEIGAFTVAQLIMGVIGVLATAAHQVALMLASQTFAICVGVGAATSVAVGRAVGAGQRDVARSNGWIGVGIGAGFMGCSALVMLAIPETLARLVTNEPEVLPLAATLLRIAAAFQVVDGIQAVAAGALRGVGDTRFTFIANTVGHWALGLPLGLFLTFVLGAGPQGIWWGLTLGLAAVAVALLVRFGRLEATAFDSTEEPEEEDEAGIGLPDGID